LVFIENVIVPNLETKIRLSDFDVSLLTTIPSKKALKKAIKKKRIYINDNIGFSGDYLWGGELIKVKKEFSILKPILNLKIDVLFENESFAIVNKPAGISTSGNQFRTLENCLPYNLTISKHEDFLSRPLVIHRLDFATSGIVIVGKTQSATINLNKQFENKQVQKKYYSVALGKMQENQTVETPVDGKSSLTHFKVLKTLKSEKYKFINLIEAEPITGRRHQIRKHLLHLGHPICGDHIYNKNKSDIKGNGLYLHAYNIEFYDPLSGEKVIMTTPLPKKFKRLFH